jgi:hypothetical protein
MRQWLIADPSRRKTPRGVRKFVVGWLGRAQDKPRPRQQFGPASGLTRKGDNRFNSQTLREFMVEPIDWAPGLPLNGSASDFAFYRK